MTLLGFLNHLGNASSALFKIHTLFQHVSQHHHDMPRLRHQERAQAQDGVRAIPRNRSGCAAWVGTEDLLYEGASLCVALSVRRTIGD
jgi:hypothetical protein